MADPKPARWRVLLRVLMAVAVIAAFLPALDVFIAGDDFEWLDASYDIVGDPLSSLGLINHFFRPLVKWTYLGDYLIFGQIGVGYMATNLLVHFLNSLLLYALLERRLLQPVGAAAAAAAFALSPLHSEAVLWAAGRPDTVLLTCWLGALLLLDRWFERPTACRAAAFNCVALLGIGAKESWIVFPFLVVAYLVLVLGLPLRTALRRVVLLWTAWVVYIIVFLVIPVVNGAQSAAHYADFRFQPALIKTSATALGFCGFGWVPIEGWAAVGLSTLIVVGTAGWLIRTHDSFGLWALLWLTATLALVAPFPMAVLRHNYLPMAGFWMVVAAIVDRSLTSVPSADTGRRRRRLTLGLVSSATIVVLAVEGWAMQREIADYRFFGDFHRQLCVSFAAIEPKISRKQPLVFVERGTIRGVEVVADAVQGCDKTFFVRRDALWQLVFLPPLANFVGRPFEERLEKVEMAEGVVVPDAFTVLLFEDTGFSLRPDLQDAVAKAIDAPDGIPPGVSLYRFSAR
jgi:hypothetical protein